MVDVEEYYRTAKVYVTRCPHCSKKFRVSGRRGETRISPLMLEGKTTGCPACRKKFVIKLISDEAESRRRDRELGAEFDRLTREHFLQKKAQGRPAGLRTSLVPAAERWALVANTDPTRPGDVNRGASVVRAELTKPAPPFSVAAWGCGTLVLGLILYVPCAIVPLLVFDPDIGCPLGLLAGVLLAGLLCYHLEKDRPARETKRAQARREREATRRAKNSEGWGEQKWRERAAFHEQHPELSYQAYMAESGRGIDHLQQAVGLPPLVTGVLKMTSCIGRLLLSPVDYPMWRAVKQGKMSQGDRVAIQLGIVYFCYTVGTNRLASART